MCDVCSDFLKLLTSYENQISRESTELPLLTRLDISTLFIYIQTWSARQCMCCFRDAKNIERFSVITQGVIHYAVFQLKELSVSESMHQVEKSDEDAAAVTAAEMEELAANNVHETDKLLILVSKIFVLNFPLYSAYKQYTIHRKLDDLTQQEMQNLNVFCDLQDTDIPVNLIKNVGLFCKFGGLLAMTRCFTGLSPKFLPVSTAHAMISIVCNLKIWMNYKSVMTMLVPLRSCVLRYMCKLSDQDLRTPTIKSMADFMWNAIKDPLEHPAVFDIDGLDLAFKYFTSSTLTMRLAGISQINSQIGLLAEMCVNNSGIVTHPGVGVMVSHVMGGCNEGGEETAAEAVPRLMCDWLLHNGIITHLFGPNMHAEVIKQSHIILNFLAMENHLNSDHIDTIWTAAQLKHCAKPVHDLLPGLVKHLSVTPALHLYTLLVKLPPRDHTEQTLYLASALIKFIWTRAGGAVIGVPGQIDANLIGLAASTTGLPIRKCAPSSSENSVSLDASNSEEEHVSVFKYYS